MVGPVEGVLSQWGLGRRYLLHVLPWLYCRIVSSLNFFLCYMYVFQVDDRMKVVRYMFSYYM